MAHHDETSAKTGQNVDEVFIRAAKMLYLKHKNQWGQVETKKPMGGKIRPNSNASGPQRDGAGGSGSGCKC